MPKFFKKGSKKKKDQHHRPERPMENEMRRVSSQRQVFSPDLYPSKWRSEGDIDSHRRHYRCNSLPSISDDHRDYQIQELKEANSRSQERLDWIEQNTTETNRLVQNLCRSVESLLRMADDDLFYKNDFDEDEDDLFSEAPHKYVVRQSLLDLKKSIAIDGILDELFSRNAIDHSEHESVRVQSTDTRKARRLATIMERKPAATFEAFLAVLRTDEHNVWLFEDLKRKYDVAKRNANLKCCAFCYVSGNTDVRQLADHMYENRTLDSNNYEFLVNDAVSATERWQTLRKLTPVVSEARDGFINSLQDVYPETHKNIRFAFSLDKGSLQCTCSNPHRRASKNSEPRTIKKRAGAQLAKDIKSYHTDDESTIKKYLNEENESNLGADIIPDIVATSRPRDIESSTSNAQISPNSSPIVESSPIIRCTSVETLDTLDLNNDETDQTQKKTKDQPDGTQKAEIAINENTSIGTIPTMEIETTEVDRYKYISFFLGLVILFLILTMMVPDGVNGFLSFVKDVPHRILDACLSSNTR